WCSAKAGQHLAALAAWIMGGERSHSLLTVVLWNEALVCGNTDAFGPINGVAAESAGIEDICCALLAGQMVTALQGGLSVAGSPEPARVAFAGALRRKAAVTTAEIEIGAVAMGAIARVLAFPVLTAGGALRAVGLDSTTRQARPLPACEVIRTGGRVRAA